jgi:hypothetical protein
MSSNFSRSKTFTSSSFVRNSKIKEDLEVIKKSAFETWSKPIAAETTYSQYFSEPKYAQRENRIQSLLPRRNNPHPPM